MAVFDLSAGRFVHFSLMLATFCALPQGACAGVDAARVLTKGLGDAKPSAPNTTAEGRAQNRRVEIVRQ